MLAYRTAQGGGKRIVRAIYELRTLEALCDQLNCKGIWVVGAVPRPLAAGRVHSPGRPHVRSRAGWGLELLMDAFVQRYLPHAELAGEGVHGNHAVVAFEQVHEPADEIRVAGQRFSSR
jgi:hypothetical protein